MAHRHLGFVSIILLLALLIASPALSAQEGPIAPVLAQGAPDTLPGRYIVVFKDGVGPSAADAVVNNLNAEVHYRYSAALNGFAATLPEQSLQGLQRNPLVAYIEADQQVWAWGSQSNPTWGLDRIDQRSLPLNGAYNYNQTGAGVTAYILDTGIRYSHNDFGGRANFGFDAFGGDGVDCNGHGTHVAGTVGGAIYGVAKSVSLVAVRVLDCNGSGSTSGVIAGIDWVTANPVKPAVANMSLGGGASSTLDTAVQNSIAAGVSYAVAAGNGNFLGIAQNACNYSPARVPAAMTIGATDNTDKKASWSNYGDCVDWFAPGVSITSAWYTSNTATNTISGTSMATPHTAGAAALYLEAYPSASPAQVRNALYDLTTKGIVTSSNTANNHLLYSLFGGSAPNNPPVASFTYACTYLACSFDGSQSSDSDGSIVSYAWNFGDNSTGSGVSATHTYGAAGAYSVTLTVTDNGGLTGAQSQSVTVTSASGSITLSVVGRKVRGLGYADLSWSGATSASVDVFRNGSKVVTTSNSGAYTDNLGRSRGTFTYRVCEAGTSNCSNDASVTF